MSLDSIINSIQSHKNEPNLNFELKSKTELFTDQLFHMLFDANVSVAKSIEKLEQLFDEITTIACFKPKNTCKEVWMNFLEKLPAIKPTF